MTLFAVIGEGSINKKELAHQLDDLKTNAEEEGQFWLLLEGKETPTQADTDLVAWADENGVFYATLTADGVELSDIYVNASDSHTYDGQFATSLVEAMVELQENNEGSKLLALLVNPKEDVPEDNDAAVALEAALDAGFEVFGLNDSMEPITLEASPEPEQEAPKAPAKTAATKKAASKKAEPAEAEGPEVEQAYTRTELEGFTPPEVKALAVGMGITARTKKEQIEAILQAQGTGETTTAGSGNANITSYSATTTTSGVPNVTWYGSGGTTTANGDWSQVPSGKVLVVMHAANGSVITKLVDEDKVAAL